jgi:hypothetical protein
MSFSSGPKFSASRKELRDRSAATAGKGLKQTQKETATAITSIRWIVFFIIVNSSFYLSNNDAKNQAKIFGEKVVHTG